MTEQELVDRNLGYKSIIEMEKTRSLDLRQKTRIKWAVDRDENTRFFHGYIYKINRKNLIDGLKISGEWCTDLTSIKQGIYSFFADKFNEKWPIRPKLVSRHFKKIYLADSKALEVPISLQKIKNAVWACGNEKAPEPDGFTFKFIKKYWDVLLGDISAVVKYFELHGKLDSSCNSSFISLVPKVKDPLLISNYKPISFIGCIYKIISKILLIMIKKSDGAVY